MNYQDYKDARDASWHILIDCKVTELPVRISGVARKSMLPKFVELKPKVSVPAASRPVLNRPPNTLAMVEVPRARPAFPFFASG